MNRLERHEAAQRHSRALREEQGARTLSFSTTEVVDYLAVYPLIPSGGVEIVAVEIKTGESRLSPRQKEWVEQPALDTYVEFWELHHGEWVLRKVEEHLRINAEHP